MGYMERYIAGEHAAEFQAGRITYAELIRRLTYLTGTLLAALALAATMGCTAEVSPTASRTPAATGIMVPPSAPSATVIMATAAATVPTQATVMAAPATAPGITVREDDPTIEAGNVVFQNAGVTLMGYLARPKSPGPHPAVLVIHENRGLVQPHFPDVARRLAKEGYVALALDLLSREGGTANLPDLTRASRLLGSASDTRLMDDMNGGVRYLQGLSYARAERIGAMGFCFGGGMVWLLCARNPDIVAAATFYGPQPPLSEVGHTRASILGVYGATDARINAGIAGLETALKENGKTYDFNVYEGAGHAFFNGTGRSYNESAARAAWSDTLAWFQRYLKA